jgi:hypothetical protein
MGNGEQGDGRRQERRREEKEKHEFVAEAQQFQWRKERYIPPPHDVA